MDGNSEQRPYQFSLRALLIVAAVGPPIFAVVFAWMRSLDGGGWFVVVEATVTWLVLVMLIRGGLGRGQG